MSIKEKINSDLKEALKNKEELKISVLRGINSALKNKEIEKRTKISKEEKDTAKLEKLSLLTEEEVVEVLLSEAKKRKDAIEEFKKGNRMDLAEKEEKELKILEEYLPEQMSEEEIKEEAKRAIEEVKAIGPRDMGRVMSVLMPKLKGKADGKTVSKIVNDLLK